MEQAVVLVRNREWENDTWSDFFSVSNTSNPEQTFRDTIKEYLLTEEGKQEIKQSCEDFNWGDVLMCIPEEFWNKHGIKTISESEGKKLLNPIFITVEQDEVLIPDEYHNSKKI